MWSRNFWSSTLACHRDTAILLTCNPRTVLNPILHRGEYIWPSLTSDPEPDRCVFERRGVWHSQLGEDQAQGELLKLFLHLNPNRYFEPKRASLHRDSAFNDVLKLRVDLFEVLLRPRSGSVALGVHLGVVGATMNQSWVGTLAWDSAVRERWSCDRSSSSPMTTPNPAVHCQLQWGVWTKPSGISTAANSTCST